MSPGMKKLNEEIGVEETLNRLIRFGQVAHAWEQATGEKLNTTHYIAVLAALNKENK